MIHSYLFLEIKISIYYLTLIKSVHHCLVNAYQCTYRSSYTEKTQWLMIPVDTYHITRNHSDEPNHCNRS